MVETVLTVLIWIAIIVGLVVLAIYVLKQLGVAVPPRVVQIVGVIVLLIILLILWRAFGSSLPAI